MGLATEWSRMGSNIKNQKRSDNRLDCPTDKPSHKPIWDWPRSGLVWVAITINNKNAPRQGCRMGRTWTGWSGFYRMVRIRLWGFVVCSWTGWTGLNFNPMNWGEIWVSTSKNQKRSDNRLDCPTDKPPHKPIWDWPRSGLVWVAITINNKNAPRQGCRLREN